MRKIISVLVPFVALVLLTSCKSITGPTPPTPPGPTEGMITFIEQTSVPCDPASPFGSKRFSLDTIGWPPGYLPYVQMESQGNDTWAVTIKAPASTSTNQVWMVSVIDACIWSLGTGPWGLASGTGLSVEPEGHSELRVRLRDATDMTGFSFTPPDKIASQ